LDWTPKRLLAVGGGTNNRIWLQTTSDVSGLDQIIRKKTIGASYGDAFLAALAIGAVDRDAIDRWNPVERTVKAAPSAIHANRYQLFRRLYEQTRDIAAEIGSP
ncbi:MAG: carbohydrate kinase, partial [Alphaproteobacteria bacterium]